MIGDYAPNDQWRARRLAWLSMAAIAGLFIGPMLGGFATGITTGGSGLIALDGTFFSAPFILTSIVSVVAASAVYTSIPKAAPEPHTKQDDAETLIANRQAIQLILALTFIVAGAVGVFEVGLALRTIQTLEMDATHLALMFSECSIVMFVAQAIVFSPLVRPEATRRLLAPAFVTMAAGVALVGGASDFTILLLGVGAIAAGGGIVFPVLTYWLSLAAGAAQGAELGKQSAAGNLGQAIGSGVGGLFFGISFLPSASFMGMAALLSFGAVISLVATRRLTRLGAPLTTPILQFGQKPAERRIP
jgi:predicted MFS family arabinose efflux permease